MSIFHCLVIDSTTNNQRSNHRKPKPIPLCTSLRIIPKPNLNTEYYNRFVDPYNSDNCKFECTVAEHSKEKNFKHR